MKLTPYLTAFAAFFLFACGGNPPATDTGADATAVASSDETAPNPRAIKRPAGYTVPDSLLSVQPPYPFDEAALKTTPSGLKYQVIVPGAGSLPTPGDKVIIHYHGLLEDGTVFDSSVERGQPFNFALGQGQVIAGWDEGVAMMPVGTKAILVTPPDLAYGAQARGKIPANATLFFHVEVLGVVPG